MELGSPQEVNMNARFAGTAIAAALALVTATIQPAQADTRDSHHDHGSPPSGHGHSRSDHGGHYSGDRHGGGHYDGRHDGHYHHDRSSVRLGITLGTWWGYPYYYRPYRDPYVYYYYYNPYYYPPSRYAPPPPPSYRYYQYTPPPPPASGTSYPCLQEREYQTTVTVGGRQVEAYGTACLQPDGSWRRGPAMLVPPD
jgi:hypothetical protein